jgi:hypothetical protein
MTAMTDIPTVPSADEMNDDIFIRHFNLRHTDSLGGLKALPFIMDPYVLGCYRSFHSWLHRQPFRHYDHYHAE